MNIKSDRRPVITDRAPKAIGTYSQGIKKGGTIYLSGQIPLVPETMEMVEGDMSAQIHQVFRNLGAVAHAGNASMDEVVKLNVYLTDLEYFPLVNEIMAEYFSQPYPARAAIGVAALPRGAGVEMDAIIEIDEDNG